MKKSKLLIFTLITAITIFSCKEVKKEEQKEEQNTTVASPKFTVDKTASTISWTAYKTTDKVPVKGSFTKFSIENQPNGTNIKEAINGLAFKIPVSSLYTKDTIRDAKLINSFFGSMTNTSDISGTLHFTDEKLTADISMNGISYTFPMNYAFNGNKVMIDAEINLDNWKAQAAIEALNLVCKELHTGPDGISKTWNDVLIQIVIEFQES